MQLAYCMVFVQFVEHYFECLVMEIDWGASTKENDQTFSSEWANETKQGSKFVFLCRNQVIVILKTSGKLTDLT